MVAPCKVSYDPTTAKEMLLMAPSQEEQQFWVSRLLKKIQKSGYKATGQVGVARTDGVCTSEFSERAGWHQDLPAGVDEIAVQTQCPGSYKHIRTVSHIGSLVRWSSCTLAVLYAGSLVRWQSCTLAVLYAGSLVRWKSCALAVLYVGILVCW